MNSSFLKNLYNKFFLRVSLQEQTLFAKNLAVMTKAGMPLLDSLRMLQKQSRSKAMVKILSHLSEDVSNGQFLSKGMEEFSGVFGNFAINIIRVGEASGILYENLNYLAEELRKKRELKRKVVGAMIYPIIIVIATLAITGLLTVYIFPKILPVFKSLKVDLPITTRVLIIVSEFLINYGGFTLLGILAAIVILWLIIQIRQIRFLIHKINLYLPFIGKMSKDFNMANFTRTLGLLLRSDIKVVEALSITSDTLKNLVYKKEIKEMSREISEGEEISKHMDRNPHLFPAMTSQLVAIGEKTGNLSETLIYLSEFYENDLDEITKNLSTVLEPVLMIVMGGIVAFIALSIITPIYEVTQAIHK